MPKIFPDRIVADRPHFSVIVATRRDGRERWRNAKGRGQGAQLALFA
jgi:hypothetical protein